MQAIRIPQCARGIDDVVTDRGVTRARTLWQAPIDREIVEVRQLGLAAALKFADPHGGAMMMSALFKHRVWAVAAAFDLSVIQIKPPLIIDRAELDLLLEALHNAIVDCSGHSRVRA